MFYLEIAQSISYALCGKEGLIRKVLRSMQTPEKNNVIVRTPLRRRYNNICQKRHSGTLNVS